MTASVISRSSGLLDAPHQLHRRFTGARLKGLVALFCAQGTGENRRTAILILHDSTVPARCRGSLGTSVVSHRLSRCSTRGDTQHES